MLFGLVDLLLLYCSYRIRNVFSPLSSPYQVLTDTCLIVSCGPFVSLCVCLSISMCLFLLFLNSLVLLSSAIHYYYNIGLYLIICCYLMLFLFCPLDCKLLESRNSVFILYSSWCQLFLICSINPCGMNDIEAYALNKSYVCKLAGLRSAVSSGLGIYGSLARWGVKNQQGGMSFGQRAPLEV